MNWISIHTRMPESDRMVWVWSESAEDSTEAYFRPGLSPGEWIALEGRMIMEDGWFWMPKPNGPMSAVTWETGE